MKQSSLKGGWIKGLTPKALVVGGDYPHLRYGGKWQESTKSDLASTPEHPGLNRLIFYADELRKLGMDDHYIKAMFVDLYWDAYTEFRVNGTPMAD